MHTTAFRLQWRFLFPFTFPLASPGRQPYCTTLTAWSEQHDQAQPFAQRFASGSILSRAPERDGDTNARDWMLSFPFPFFEDYQQHHRQRKYNTHTAKKTTNLRYCNITSADSESTIRSRVAVGMEKSIRTKNFHLLSVSVALAARSLTFRVIGGGRTSPHRTGPHKSRDFHSSEESNKKKLTDTHTRRQGLFQPNFFPPSKKAEGEDGERCVCFFLEVMLHACMWPSST